jgi:hypothetical protein
MHEVAGGLFLFISNIYCCLFFTYLFMNSLGIFGNMCGVRLPGGKALSLARLCSVAIVWGLNDY